MENKNAVNENAFLKFSFFFGICSAVILSWFILHEWAAKPENELDQLSRTTIGEAHAQAQSKGTTPSVIATTEETLREAYPEILERISSINDTAKVTSIKPTPMGSVYEVVAGGNVMYWSGDGRYMFHGTLLDMQERINLTDVVLSETRAVQLDAVPQSEKIVFQPKGEVKHVVRVFTDTTCGYCTKLHNEIDSYLDLGIQVEYLAWPRGGDRSPAAPAMQAIWCSSNRNTAFDLAVAGEEVPSVPCKSPVSEHYELGVSLGVQGTPAIYTVDGVQIGGYLEAGDMLKQLEAKKKMAELRGS